MNPQVTLPRAAISDFCRTHAIRELAIFGSAVGNNFTAESDIDVLIDLDSDARVGLVAMQRMRDELSRIIGRPVDLLTRNGLNRHIREEVLRNAEVIHAE
jgi:predicted nucleotidyltransferase